MSIDSTWIDGVWDASIVPALVDYIRIPNKSPHFDSEWHANGHMRRAVELLARWCEGSGVAGLTHEIVELEGRTPLLFAEVPGSTAGAPTVLLYGHYDKQPEFTGWREGLGPWTPVLRDGRLYGRGGADDGYAIFASLTAIAAVQRAGHEWPRCVLLIEGCEESGSFDLPGYLDALAPRIGEPVLVVCLDAEAGDYGHLWMSTSLRGLLLGTLRVDVLTEGVHSGAASGIVPSSFRIARRLLDRIEDSRTGRMLDALHVDIPAHARADAESTAASLGDTIVARYPWAGATRPTTTDRIELVLHNTWRPALSVTGFAGAPDVGQAGNTLRPYTALKLSIRLPPTLEPSHAAAAVQHALERDPPQGATVRFDHDGGQAGWAAPSLAPWLRRAFDAAAQRHFRTPVRYLGMGGTIPFLKMLGARYPDAQYMVTGVLGPQSNAHGPNEFLDIATGKRVTACVADVLCAVERGMGDRP
jgi:acetylornithine deacetylase/succinyl-diaminopimelate desuccinylase-like protein